MKARAIDACVCSGVGHRYFFSEEWLKSQYLALWGCVAQPAQRIGVFVTGSDLGRRWAFRSARIMREGRKRKREEMTIMTPEPYVTADDAAAHLKITRRQVLEMTRKGIIPAYPLGTGKHRRVWRFKISEVDAAIASGTRKPSASNEDRVLAETSSQRTMPIGSPRSQKGKL
jgi:excisionase family DNA binding protein